MRSALIAFAVVAALGVAAFALLGSESAPPTAAKLSVATKPAAEPVPTADDSPDEIIIKLPVNEAAQRELKYLPQDAALADAPASPMIEKPIPPPGQGSLEEVMPLTSIEEHGMFINPQLSPDGLQVLMTRPGEGGLYLMSISGGEAVLIADANGFNARWTADGRIAVDGEGDMVNIYGPDGLLEEARYEPKPAYSNDDTIYVRPSPGEAGVPITSGDDRYYAPVVSPDGSKIVYSGLYTGLYLANADGSGRPIYLGPGNNPVWTPDADGVIFDHTTDDGHVLIDGRIMYGGADGSERTELTPSGSFLAQRPSIGSGGRVLFESGGVIHSGFLRRP